MAVNFLIPIVGFVAMIGVSFLISFGYTSYESEDHSLVVTEMETLLVRCEGIHDVDTWNDHVDHKNSFIGEYGEFDRVENDIIIASGNYEVMTLIDKLNSCESRKDQMLNRIYGTELE